ncbi:YicC family protein [Sagittula sp. M10.9X]|uniref:YicC family protein n=2 Tax=Sagittula salina TaxID=2820268 RepID=A0A940MNL0_9RHOB|nr:YicC family protein [Sagittula salina]
MTGFGAAQGAGLGLSWTWELRGVNGKGLDLRLRLPDWVEGLEAQVRSETAKALTRGNIQVGLKVVSEQSEGALRLDEGQLSAVLDAMARIEAQAMEQGLSLAPSTAAEIVGLRGVMTAEAAEVDIVALRALLLADYARALSVFVGMRQSEGAALQQILERQLGEIEALVAESESAAEARSEAQTVRLGAQLARVMDNAEGADPDRVAQELALIAVKSDVTEEIDRLRSHVAAARALLAEQAPVGRKLDFLCQEFNREANTLCSKSGDPELTRAGLALKTLIDQMREQVQNVE